MNNRSDQGQYTRRDDSRGDDRRDDRGNDRGGDRGGDRRDDRRGRGTPLSDLDPALTDVSRRVIGAAIEVHRALGPGFPESAYTKALCMELDAGSIAYKVGAALPIMYKDKEIGTTPADLFVDNRFIVEVMAHTGEVGSAERSTLRAQLRAADVELGLIINFGERRLKDGLVRVLNPDKLNAMRGDSEGGGDHDEGEASTHDFDGQ
jgi:GxxExxY protein